MQFDVGVALTWILFLALFPISFFWLRRAWRIQVRRDLSEVALKRGEPPADPARWARWEMAINAIGGAMLVYVIGAVLLAGLPYETWTAIAGSTIWCKFFASVAISRQAHAGWARKKV